MQTVINTLSKIKLSDGSPGAPNKGLRVMECEACVAGKPRSDCPQCACDVITFVAIYATNLFLPKLGEALARRVAELAGSKADFATTSKRAYFLVDQVVRVHVPAGIQLASPEIAAKLRALPAIDSPEKVDYLKLARLEVESLEGIVCNGAMLSSELLKVLSALRAFEFGDVAYYMIQMLTYTHAPVDVLELMDQLLAIKPTTAQC